MRDIRKGLENSYLKNARNSFNQFRSRAGDDDASRFMDTFQFSDEAYEKYVK